MTVRRSLTGGRQTALDVQLEVAARISWPRRVGDRDLHPNDGGALEKRDATLFGMTLTLKETVRGGRLLMDEPVDLPDGTEVELVPANDGDDLDDEDRARLHAAITRSAEQFRAGRGVAAEEVLRGLGSAPTK